MSKCSDDCNRIDNLDEILENIPNENDLYDYSEIMKALADPTRLKIVYLLSQTKELCVCEILDALDKSQSTVSHHLSILKKANILDWEKKGLWVYYSLSNPNLIENLNLIVK
jgi:DNA-binding transcriptional ArsR family regulator|nr:metalloregulator ArsR/SmtB family transcription factor [Methanobrevibacter smithii]